MNIEVSKLWELSGNDFFKGMIVAVLTAVLDTVYQVMQTGGISALDYKAIGSVAAFALVAYLVKNFGTDHNGKILGINPPVGK